MSHHGKENVSNHWWFVETHGCFTLKSYWRYGLLFPKLFWLIARKKCSSDREKLLKLEAEGGDVAKFLKSVEQFIQTAKSQKNFLKQNGFFNEGFSDWIY